MKDIFTTVVTLTIGVTAISFVYVVCTILYNTLLHPLRKYPGSVFAAATPLPLMYSRAMGQIVKWTQVQHNRYGSVVRMSPNELSFIDAEAWDNIFGHGRASKFKNVEFIKDPRLVGPDLFVKPGEPAGIMRADHSAHATQRRLLSPAFSDKALKDQEPLLQSYVDILINQWRTICDKGNATGDAVADLVLWYNFTTFDIMADLTFGEPLHMLDRGEYTPWVNALFTTFKLLMFNLACKEIPILARVLGMMIPNSVREKRKQHMAFSSDRVNTRLAIETDRPDIWSYILRHAKSNKEVKGLSLEQMYSNSSSFMIAGTETTATQLAGLTFLLLKNLRIMEKLTNEIRSAFDQQGAITMQSLAQMEYLNACIEEGLRLYPPVPVGTSRITPEPGATVCGQFVPAGTIVSIPHYSAYHSSSNFHLPDEFHPERWLSQAPVEFAHDQKHVLQPFSYGPRNCLGKNLAYHEMRLVLANVLRNFDLALCYPSDDWMAQGCFILWEKRPLLVQLKAVRAN